MTLEPSRKGRLDDFSTDRLFRILNKMGVSVSMVLTDEVDWRPGLTTVQDAATEASAWMEPSDEEGAAFSP